MDARELRRHAAEKPFVGIVTTMTNLGWLTYAICLLTLAGVTVVGQDQEQFQVDAAATSVTIRVGRAGVFGFAGHDHEIVAPAVKGTIVMDRSQVDRSSVSLEFDATALKVTGKGEPAQDVPEVQRVMLSDRVLDVQRYPTIRFQSRSVSLIDRTSTRMRVRVTGELTLHGVTRPLTVPVRVELTADRLTAEGEASVRQTDFGIQPVTAGAGTVRVRNQLELVFKVSARKL
jgi:polyisoprenoid-binding protein YceI